MGLHKVYWAGELFDVKQLLGNRMLADAFDAKAAGRWKALLPQESEANAQRTNEIRDDDLERLFTCDAIVANFDGTDLDSGTVVEFCFAKFLDLPAVLLRTDLRTLCDGDVSPDPWNLMCSSYPRTETLLYNAMCNMKQLGFPAMLQDIGGKIVDALERSAAKQPVYKDFEQAVTAFKFAVISAGGTVPARFSDERIRSIIANRREL